VHEFDPAKRRGHALRQLLADSGFTYAVAHITPLPWRQPRGLNGGPFPGRSSAWVEAINAWRPGRS